MDVLVDRQNHESFIVQEKNVIIIVWEVEMICLLHFVHFLVENY